METYELGQEMQAPWNQSVKITESKLSFFLFYFWFIFYFSIFRNSGARVRRIGHTVTSVTSDGVVTTLIMGLERRE